MSPEFVVDIFQDALALVVMIIFVLITPGLLVGLIVAIFQAATSINEQTLSFLPRLIVTLSMFIFVGHWFFGKLIDFTHMLVEQVPYFIS